MPEVELQRLLRLPQRPDEIWQGGFVLAPTWVQAPGEKPFRPLLPLWIDTRTENIHSGHVQRPEDATFAHMLEALVEFACHRKHARCRPGRIEVRDPLLARYLAERLAGAGIEIEEKDALLVLDAATEAIARHSQEDAPPGLLESPGVDLPLVRGLAVAAAEFFRARAWDLLTDEDRICVESPVPDAGLGCFVVLGAGGITVGLGFFTSPEDHDAVNESEDLHGSVARAEQWALLYGPLHELPFADADLWVGHDLPVVGAGAYPQLIHTLPQGTQPPHDAAVLRWVEGLLLAVARSGEEEIDSGRWTKSVETSSGSMSFVLAIPDLLRPIDAEPPATGGRSIFRRPVAERALVDLQRVMEGKSFESKADLNAFLEANLVGEAVHQPATTPFERAQDLVFAAQEERGHRRRIRMAREALKVCPDCADAHVLLAEEAGSPGSALGLYEKAEEVARRVLGPRLFEENVGSFWGILETRPFMRAKLGRANCLNDLDHKPEAVEHYEELLRLNPNDNQGVRDVLAVCLLELERHAELAALLDRYRDDATALPHYVRALLAFRTEGGTPGAAHLLGAAMRANRHVPPFLLDRRPLPPPSDSYRIGHEDEAAHCVAELGETWDATPGAREWLAGAAAAARGTNKTTPKRKKKTAKKPKKHRRRR